MSTANMIRALNLIEKMAVSTETSMDKVAKILRLQFSNEAEEAAERRSSPAEKDIIEAKVQELFGKNPDYFNEVTPKEIAREIGVRVNQGNRSRIRHKVKQLLLTHQPAAKPANSKKPTAVPAA